LTFQRPFLEKATMAREVTAKIKQNTHVWDGVRKTTDIRRTQILAWDSN
jgi:hypothetical protein